MHCWLFAKVIPIGYSQRDPRSFALLGLVRLITRFYGSYCHFTARKAVAGNSPQVTIPSFRFSENRSSHHWGKCSSNFRFRLWKTFFTMLMMWGLKWEMTHHVCCIGSRKKKQGSYQSTYGHEWWLWQGLWPGLHLFVQTNSLFQERQEWGSCCFHPSWEM